MGKRIRKITYAFLIVALFTVLNTKVSYAERKQLNIEQAVGNPPEITAYVNGEKVSKEDRKSTRLNSSHDRQSRMPSSA